MSNSIFDFDGTIADSFALVVGIGHELTGQTEPLTEAQIERLRGMSFRQIAREVNLPLWKVPFLLAKGRKMMWAAMDKVQPFPEMATTIAELKARGDNLYIMSSNSVQNIELFLEHNDMRNDFIKIYGSVGLFGKAQALKHIVRQNELDPNQTWYVGDEVRDVQAAHKAGIRAASVTWGYNTAEALARHQPDLLVAKVSDLATGLK